MILSQLIESRELEQLTPEALREMILHLDQQIRIGTGEAGEKVLVTFEADVVGVKDDRPAGNPKFTKLFDGAGVKADRTVVSPRSPKQLGDQSV